MKKFLILAVVGLTVLWGLYFKMSQSMHAPLNLEQTQLIVVKPGANMHKFSKQLVESQLIDSRFWLRNYARLNPDKVAIKSGTYQITPSDTVLSLLDKIVSGKEHQFSMTFVEGSTYKEWLAALSQHPQIKQSTPSLDSDSLRALLGVDELNVEGLLFPDTYAFTAGTLDKTLIKRAYVKMQQELDSAWENRQQGLPYKSSYEALIMASIIEKETGLISEQSRIASVFVNRLRKKMRLQTDPTIIYGLGERYKGDITRAHMREKTAYNTYRIDGLPPTPIAMPGLSAIQAALHPEASDYFYFVSKGDGSHYFSKDLAEHNKAVRKYILGKS
ncbi:endolytic transglycosylase MltG [Thalassotalea euphylliae]|uniref:endolytic transglycosylase MltG n=1 Tax=Thalassotalea euphylliae TaxID=1655234 RepID=UPI00362F3F47